MTMILPVRQRTEAAPKAEPAIFYDPHERRVVLQDRARKLLGELVRPVLDTAEDGTALDIAEPSGSVRHSLVFSEARALVELLRKAAYRAGSDSEAARCCKSLGIQLGDATRILASTAMTDAIQNGKQLPYFNPGKDPNITEVAVDSGEDPLEAVGFYDAFSLEMSAKPAASPYSLPIVATF